MSKRPGLTQIRQKELLLYGDERYSGETNASILKNTIIFLKLSERFNTPLMSSLSFLFFFSVRSAYVFVFLIFLYAVPHR